MKLCKHGKKLNVSFVALILDYHLDHFNISATRPTFNTQHLINNLLQCRETRPCCSAGRATMIKIPRSWIQMIPPLTEFSYALECANFPSYRANA